MKNAYIIERPEDFFENEIVRTNYVLFLTVDGMYMSYKGKDKEGDVYYIGPSVTQGDMIAYMAKHTGADVSVDRRL